MRVVQGVYNVSGLQIETKQGRFLEQWERGRGGEVERAATPTYFTINV